MKKLLLVACLFPGMLMAASDGKNAAARWQRMFQSNSALRSAPAYTLDSVYVFEDGELRMKEHKRYDAEGRLASETIEQRNVWGDGKWELSWRTDFSHYYTDNEGGTAWTETTFNPDESGELVEVSRSKNHRLDSGLQDYYESYRQVDGEWKMVEKWKPVDWEGGLPVAVVDSSYEDDRWVVTKQTVEYDAWKRPSRGGFYYWNEETKVWDQVEKINFEYESSPGLNYTIRHFILNESGEWYDSYGYTYEFDERGNQITELGYDEGFTMLETRRNFYSDEVITHNETPRVRPAASWSVVPATRTLVVDLPERALSFGLYSLQGNCLMQQTLEAGRHEISLAGFPSGIYVLRVGSSSSKVKL